MTHHVQARIDEEADYENFVKAARQKGLKLQSAMCEAIRNWTASVMAPPQTSMASPAEGLGQPYGSMQPADLTAILNSILQVLEHGPIQGIAVSPVQNELKRDFDERIRELENTNAGLSEHVASAVRREISKMAKTTAGKSAGGGR